ncbi:unnamed protein product [Durusdinium trenchii]|uniref:Uncharacterized protein n=1 Tax=Durusdinium trenchii TaxID=1381693 RepID=A0ABP0QUS8_9DINO
MTVDDSEDPDQMQEEWLDYDFDPASLGHSSQESEWSEPQEPIQVEPEPKMHAASPLSSSPAPWRCACCDSHEYYELNSIWTCSRCASTDFYQPTRPMKRVTTSGTWMFVPHHADGSEPQVAKARTRRRRRARMTTGPPVGPPSSDAGERAESETPTVDPVTEPDPHPKAQPGPRLPRPRPQRHDRALQHDNTANDVNALSVDAGTSPKPARRQTSESSSSWNSRKGPEPGIKWKSGQYPPVPVWKYDIQDMRAFAKYKKKIAIWQLQMKAYASPKDQALLVYNSLTGEPEQELEHVPIDEIYVDTGVQKILELLQRPFEQRVIYQKRRFLQDFEQMRRYAGESMRAYVLRFRRVQRSLTAVGVNLAATFDGEALGSRLLDRSGLSHADQRLVLVGTQQSLEFEAIAECLVLHWPEFRAPPLVVNKDGKGVGKGSKSGPPPTPSSSSTSFTSSSQTSKGSQRGFPRRQAFVANATEGPAEEDEFLEAIEEEADLDAGPDGQEDEPADAGECEDDGEGQEADADLSEIADILTVTARKLSGVTLGRKFTTTNPSKKTRLPPDELKKITHCSACGGLGHWAGDPQCPHGAKGAKGGSKGKTQQQTSEKGQKNAHASSSSSYRVSMVHHDGGTDIIEHDPSEESGYGTMFTINMIECGSPFSVHEVRCTPKVFEGMMIIDSACQRNCCGQEWFDHHVEYLKSYGMIPKITECHETYQFGKGSPTVATKKAYLPCIIGGQPLLLGVALLPEKIPFLGSNSLLDMLQTNLRLPARRAEFELLGIDVELHQVAGHFAIKLFDCDVSQQPHTWHVWKRFSQPHLWRSPHAELLLPPPQMSPWKMRQAPPQWLVAWKRLVLAMSGYVSNLITYMAKAARLHLVPPDFLSRAFPPYDAHQVLSPKECDHLKVKRHGNAHGRFATCLGCNMKWRWNAACENIMGAKNWVTKLLYADYEVAALSKSKGKSKPKTSQRRPPYAQTTSSASSTATTSRMSNWTNFDTWDLNVDHLPAELRHEVHLICEQDSPLDAEPSNLAEYIFLNEEIHEAGRRKMEHTANQRRVRRLIELGVIAEQPANEDEDEMFDWSLQD